MFDNMKDDEELRSEDESFIASADIVLHRLKTKVGYTERNRHIDLNATILLTELRRHGGTFYWRDGPNAGDKFDTIWEAMAAAMPGFLDLDWRRKHEWVEEYSLKLKHGFPKAREVLMDRAKINIYYSTTYRVITLDKNYQLPNGKTAADEQYEQDAKRVNGQLNASINRAFASEGDIGARALLKKVLSDLPEGVINPQMSLFSYDNNEDE